MLYIIITVSTDWPSSIMRIADVCLIEMNPIFVTQATNRELGVLEGIDITCAGQLFRYGFTLSFAQNVRIFWTIIRAVLAFHNFKSGRT